MAHGISLPRVITNYCIVDKRTPSLRGEALGADTTGPAVARVGTIQLKLASSAKCPKRGQFASRRPENSVLRVGVGHQPKSMEDPTAAKGARVQDAGGVYFVSWGDPRGGGRAGGRLKPEIKVTIGGDRPPRVGGDVVTLKDMREFLVAYSKYEWQMHITSQDGGDRVLARRRELVDSATHFMVADAFYDGKPWVDLSEEELVQGLKRFAGVGMQQTSDEDFCRQIFRVLKMDANVPVDSRVFMQ